LHDIRDNAIYWLKIVIFFIPRLHSTPPLGGGPRRSIAIPSGMEKLEWCDYPTDKKSLRTCVTVLTEYGRVIDRQTDILRRHSPRYA